MVDTDAYAALKMRADRLQVLVLLDDGIDAPGADRAIDMQQLNAQVSREESREMHM